MEIVWIAIALGLAFVLWNSLRDPPEQDEPTCYGTYPFLNGQEAAERDCAHCIFAYGCHEDTPI